MPRHACLTMLTLLVAARLVGCAPQTLGPGGLLVGFGPLVDGKPTAYCESGAPILAIPDLQKLLDRKLPDLPRGQSLATEADMIAFVDGLLARARPGTRLLVNRRGLQESGVEYVPPEQPLDGMTLKMLLETCYHESVGVLLLDGSLLVDSRDRLNSRPAVAYYPVADLVSRRAVAGNDEGRTQQLQELIERTVRSDEPWESMGGRASIDFHDRGAFMIVTQSAEGHVRLARFLASLRVLAKLKPPR